MTDEKIIEIDADGTGAMRAAQELIADVAAGRRVEAPASRTPGVTSVSLVTWREIQTAIESYLVVFETGDPSHGPWPEDPDGGELRLIGALRQLVAAAMEAEQHRSIHLSTISIRALLSRELELT
jgi:hypothetical protein